MSLNFVFTIDGDWDEYFSTNLPDEKRVPELKQILKLIDREIELGRVIDGKLVHFVHTSPVVRDFFLRPELIEKWQEIEKNGGHVGVHCHEEELYKAWYYTDPAKMQGPITSLSNGLRKAGLTINSYRGGFMTFDHKLIPLLEQNQLFLDFSCEAGRLLKYGDVLVSDWQGASDNFYCLNYQDKCQPGDSQIFEIPLGIYIERLSLRQIWQAARKLKQRPGLQVVSVLAHTYDYVSWRMRLKIRLALSILKIYGKFITTAEALEIVRGSK